MTLDPSAELNKPKGTRLVLVGTLLVAGLLMTIPVGRAQGSEQPIESCFANFKIKDTCERLQTGREKADASHIARAKPGDRPVTVLQRAKPGNDIEDIDFVPNGPFANHIVMTAGYEVYGMPATNSGPIREPCDCRKPSCAPYCM